MLLLAGCSVGSICEEWREGSAGGFEQLTPDLAASMELRRQAWERQNELVCQFNDGGLASPELARSLLDSIAKLVVESNPNHTADNTAPSPTNDQPTQFQARYGILTDELQEWIRLREGEDHWSPDQLARFQLDCQWLFDASEPGQASINEVHRERLIQFNRTLLDLVHPDLLYRMDACRTAAIVEHDQEARRRWFYICFVGAIVGFVGSFNLNRHSPLYTFYRYRIAKNFLTGWIGKKIPAIAARKEDDFLLLEASDRTDVGLPYPLMLGAVLNCNDTPEPFLFTPKYLGLTPGKPESVIETSGWRIPGATGFVKLVDAVAISGSALAPLMTKNRALQLLFSFFNLRLGQWVCLPNKPGVTSNPPRFYGYITALFAETSKERSTRDGEDGKQPDWSYRFAADGGFVDYLGVYELLERRCRLIVVSDSGSNIGKNQLGTLARMLEKASTRLGVRFVDLDHEAPIDFDRLSQNEKRTVPQTFLCMRVRYPDRELADVPDEAYLIYVQMAITDSDPIEIRQIRKRFPVFPDEPTASQFYAEEQVAAYRQLGYHIGKRLCGEFDRWTIDDIKGSLRNDLIATRNVKRNKTSVHNSYYGWGECSTVEPDKKALSPFVKGEKPPLLSTVIRRLLTGYRMACFQEISYKAGDIYAEAIWDRGEWCFALFKNAAASLELKPSQRSTTISSLSGRLSRIRKVANAWLETLEQNADVRAAYRRAVFFDLNSSIVSLYRSQPYLNFEVFEKLDEVASACQPDEANQPPIPSLMGGLTWFKAELAVAHLCAVAFTCHQLRRGTPHAVFQIGGRDKLIDLIISIVLGEFGTEELETTTSFDWPKWSKGACPEVIEMKRCVFQGAEAVTTASFAYVLALFAAKLVTADRACTPQAELYSRIQKAVVHDRIQLLPKLITQVLRPEDNDPLNEEGAWRAFNADLSDRHLDPHVKVTIMNEPLHTQEVPGEGSFVGRRK